MGTGSSKNNKMDTILANVVAEYTVVQQVDEHHLLYLQHKSTQEEFLLREFNFTDKSNCDQLIKKLNKLKSQIGGHKHVVELAKHELVCEDGYCSKFYRVYALFKYPHRTLDDEISDRKLHQRRFLETELWSILASCILGLGHLQRQGIKHSAIKSTAILVYNDGFSNEGIIKVSVPFATAHQSLYDIALMKRPGKHLYLSPQLCKSLNEELIVPEANDYKNDTWALALTILQAGLLQYQDDVYQDQYCRINFQILANKLSRFGEIYSDKLRRMLEVMLDPYESSRPDWLELESHVALNETDEVGTLHSRSSIDLVTGKINDSSTESKPINFFSKEQHLQTNKFLESQNSPFSKHLIQSRPSSVPVFTPSKDLFQGFKSPPIYQSNLRANQLPGSFHKNSPYSTNFGSQPGIKNAMVINGMPEYAVIRTGRDNQMEVKIYPSRINNLDFLRPTKNIFPDSTYITKTRPDENLMMKVSEDYSSFPSIQFNLSSQLSNQLNNGQSLNIRDAMTDSYLPIQSDLEFVEENYSMGSKYTGNKLNGQRHGQGKFYYQDGGLYDGEWKKNKMDGYGKLYYQSGKLAYEGGWKEDKFYGQGVLHNEVPDQIFGPYDYSNLDGIGQCWTRYEGLFIDDLKQGNGTLYLSNGEKFIGNFQLDAAEGIGIFLCLDGRQVRGRWSNNQKIG